MDKAWLIVLLVLVVLALLIGGAIWISAPVAHWLGVPVWTPPVVLAACFFGLKEVYEWFAQRGK